MPKDNNKEELEEEKKQLLEELAVLSQNDPNISESDLAQIMAMIDNVLSKSKESKLKKLMRNIGKYTMRFTVMYLASILTFGIFFKTLAIENKWFIFIISLIVSAPIVLFQLLPWIGTGFLTKDFFKKYFVIAVLFMVIAYLVNTYIYQVFQFSVIWIFYMIILNIIYVLFDTYLSKKIYFY